MRRALRVPGVRLPGGREFEPGTGFTNTRQRHPPPLRATVTHRDGKFPADGLPHSASFPRLRTDLQ